MLGGGACEAAVGEPPASAMRQSGAPRAASQGLRRRASRTGSTPGTTAINRSSGQPSARRAAADRASAGCRAGWGITSSRARPTRHSEQHVGRERRVDDRGRGEPSDLRIRERAVHGAQRARARHDVVHGDDERRRGPASPAEERARRVREMEVRRSSGRGAARRSGMQLLAGESFGEESRVARDPLRAGIRTPRPKGGRWSRVSGSRSAAWLTTPPSGAKSFCGRV